MFWECCVDEVPGGLELGSYGLRNNGRFVTPNILVDDFGLATDGGPQMQVGRCNYQAMCLLAAHDTMPRDADPDVHMSLAANLIHDTVFDVQRHLPWDVMYTLGSQKILSEKPNGAIFIDRAALSWEEADDIGLSIDRIAAALDDTRPTGTGVPRTRLLDILRGARGAPSEVALEPQWDLRDEAEALLRDFVESIPQGVQSHVVEEDVELLERLGYVFLMRRELTMEDIGRLHYMIATTPNLTATTPGGIFVSLKRVLHDGLAQIDSCIEILPEVVDAPLAAYTPGVVEMLRAEHMLLVQGMEVPPPQYKDFVAAHRQFETELATAKWDEADAVVKHIKEVWLRGEFDPATTTPLADISRNKEDGFFQPVLYVGPEEEREVAIPGTPMLWRYVFETLLVLSTHPWWVGNHFLFGAAYQNDGNRVDCMLRALRALADMFLGIEPHKFYETIGKEHGFDVRMMRILRCFLKGEHPDDEELYTYGFNFLRGTLLIRNPLVVRAKRNLDEVLTMMMTVGSDEDTE